MKTNVVLIGMPAAGKSTVGVLLAKRLSKGFVDTDVLIQTREKRSLQDIVDKDGHLTLRRIEEDVLASMRAENHVIATGGSAAYSERAMRHLAAGGVVVFLDVELPVIGARLGDFGRRGLAKRPEQTLEALYHERRPLYERYADIRIDCGNLGHDELCRVIAERLSTRGSGKTSSKDGRDGARPSKTGDGRLSFLLEGRPPCRPPMFCMSLRCKVINVLP